MTQSRRIRNGQLRRDFKRLLTLLADADGSPYEDYVEVEEIAESHALYFDDNGAVKERGGR